MMKVQLVSPSSLRIVLTAEDMHRLEMEWDSFDYQDEKSRRILGVLFAQAKEETGFDGGGDRLVIRLFPKRNGGCEFLFSNERKDEEEQQAFVFESVDDLLCFRSRLCEEQLQRWVSSVCLEKGRICLILGPLTKPLREIICEYAVPVPSKYIRYHLEELREK